MLHKNSLSSSQFLFVALLRLIIPMRQLLLPLLVHHLGLLLIIILFFFCFAAHLL